MKTQNGATVVRVIRPIAMGGFGRVEEVLLSDDTRAARKTFGPIAYMTDAQREIARKRFDREVLVQESLAKHGALPVLAKDLSNPTAPAFLMPLAGMTYFDKLTSDRKAGMITPEPLFDMLNGLDEIHRLGLVHRDLKPQNVLLYGGTWVLSDYGLVGSPEPDHMTTLTSIDAAPGTAYYMAPEQARGAHKVKASADIYSFGCIVHDLVFGTRRIPYSKLVCAGPFSRLIGKCTEVDPAERFQSIAALRPVLAEALGSVVPPNPKTPADELWEFEVFSMAKWSPQKALDFIAHIEAEAPSSKESSVLADLDESNFEVLRTKLPDDWERAAIAYCEWARGGFTFSFCDVIAQQLQALVRNKQSSLELKASAILSASYLGSCNNRWYVMRRFLEMTSPAMADDLAARTVVELHVLGFEQYFLDCKNQIIESGPFHPRIAAALNLM